MREKNVFSYDGKRTMVCRSSIPHKSRCSLMLLCQVKGNSCIFCCVISNARLNFVLNMKFLWQEYGRNSKASFREYLRHEATRSPPLYVLCPVLAQYSTRDFFGLLVGLIDLYNFMLITSELLCCFHSLSVYGVRLTFSRLKYIYVLPHR